jgi:hypothetical protein
MTLQFRWKSEGPLIPKCTSHYFSRFELENVSIYQSLTAFGLTQSVHAKICIIMHRVGGSDFKFPEYF